MKINEMEVLAGITKKNIRFYEEKGLLSPSRNAENGYRDYGEEELRRLQQIKLLRKLGVPIEEIRQMLSGTHTLSDGMRRHLVTLEREQRNLEESIALCKHLREMEISLDALDAQAVLAQMEELEQGGTAFQNKQAQDVRRHFVAPIFISLLMVGLMAAVAMVLLWAYRNQPQEAPPWWFMVLLWGMCLAVAGGSLLALRQRIREIGKGEMEDAKRY